MASHADAHAIDLGDIVEIRGYHPSPPKTANLGMIAGPPHMLVFVVETEFVIFQLRDLCRYPPPGFTPRR